MSAVGNDTSFRRAEGESTQWEDIQRKMGNFPAVKRPEKPNVFRPAPERDKVTDLIEAEDVSNLDDLEDDFKDDVFLEQYRKERLRQIQEEASKRRFGSVLKIVREEFVQEVTQASQHCWVVVHLYKDKIPESALMGECIDELAAKYTKTKFVKIISTDCIHNYPDRNLPTVLIYKDADCKHNLVGSLPFGSRISPEAVAAALSKLGPICQEDGFRD